MDPKKVGLVDDQNDPVLLSQYHRRIPADGFPMYAEGVWEQIDSNKDLDLPTQQELLAQFRCDEISKEVLVPFDEVITPLEEKQATAISAGHPIVLPALGKMMGAARQTILKSFEEEASRYHKAVYKRKQTELEAKIDGRLKTLFQGQLSAAHKSGIADFSEAVTGAVKAGQKKGGGYDFYKIVQSEKQKVTQAIRDGGADESGYWHTLERLQVAVELVSKGAGRGQWPFEKRRDASVGHSIGAMGAVKVGREHQHGVQQAWIWSSWLWCSRGR